MVRVAGPGAILVKRDLADAFRHIPIHPADWWLFGFAWKGKTYEERFLPFGLRTAPRVFNYFAEGLHWILDTQGPPRAQAGILHYLDDFLAVFGWRETIAAAEYQQLFHHICGELGIQIKHLKSAAGVVVEFLGLTIDTVRMEARLPPEKKARALELVTTLSAASSSSAKNGLLLCCNCCTRDARCTRDRPRNA
jgi:hypothetical protein